MNKKNMPDIISNTQGQDITTSSNERSVISVAKVESHFLIDSFTITKNIYAVCSGSVIKIILLAVSLIVMMNSIYAQKYYYDGEIPTNAKISILAESILKYDTKEISKTISTSEENDSINIQYPVLLSDKYDTTFINKRIRQILIEQLESDSFEMKLNLHMKNILTYFEGPDDNDAWFWCEGHDSYNFKLANVTFDLFYSCESIVTLIAVYEYIMYCPGEIEFHYEDYKDNYDDVRFETYHEAYYIDISTGQEFRTKDIFKRKKVPNVEEIIEESISIRMRDLEVLNVLTDEEHLMSKKNKLIEISLTASGFFIPRPFSLDYYIPEWIPSNANIYGENTLTRLDIKQIKKYLNPSGPFATYRKSKEKKTTSLSSQNKLGEEFFLIRYDCKKDLLNHVIPLKNIDGIKTINIYYPQEEDSIKKISDKMKIWKKAFYSENGCLDKIIEYNGKEKIDFRYDFFYDSNNNIIEFSFNEIRYTDQDSSGQTRWNYQYDKNNNLIGKTEGAKKYYYTYFDDYYIEECYTYDKYAFHDYSVNKIYTKNKETHNDIYSYPDYVYKIVCEYSDMGIPVNMKYITLGGDMLIGEFKQKLECDQKGNIIYQLKNDERGVVKYIYNNDNLLVNKSRYSLYENLIINEIVIKYNSKNLPVLIRYRSESSFCNGKGLNKPQYYSINYEYW